MPADIKKPGSKMIFCFIQNTWFQSFLKTQSELRILGSGVVGIAIKRIEVVTDGIG